MPSGQPTWLHKSSTCLQRLAEMRFLYALWTANLVSQVFKMPANINKNEISVCPLDSQPCIKKYSKCLQILTKM